MAWNCEHYYVSLSYTRDNDFDMVYKKEFDDLIPVALFGVAYNF